MAQLVAEGFPLATVDPAGPRRACTIEVYPHPALLSLLKASYRIPYKVTRSAKYWKGASVRDRIDRILVEFQRIQDALEKVLGPLTFELPSSSSVATLSHLKRYEDALDALICAWVGIRFVQGAAEAYGDSKAAIWLPA
jgi:predicted RNase H-like nuclease